MSLKLAPLHGHYLEVLGWRPVPVDKDVVGPMAKDTEPEIEQVLVDACGKDEVGPRRCKLDPSLKGYTSSTPA